MRNACTGGVSTGIIEMIGRAYYRPQFTATDARLFSLFLSEHVIYRLRSRCKDNFNKRNAKKKNLIARLQVCCTHCKIFSA